VNVCKLDLLGYPPFTRQFASVPETYNTIVNDKAVTPYGLGQKLIAQVPFLTQSNTFLNNAAIIIEGTIPGFRLYENDRTPPQGLFLFRQSAGAFVIVRNTAVSMDFATSSNDLSVNSSGVVTVLNDLVVGAPTGGAKGAGTINATAVYDDNTLLTCMAMAAEFREEGRIDVAKWDALVPDIVIPDVKEKLPVRELVEVEDIVLEDTDYGVVARKRKVQRLAPVTELIPVYDEDGNGLDVREVELVEEVVVPGRTIPRIHGTARVFQAMLDSGFDPRDPEQYFAKMKADEALPGMPSQADWQHGGLSLGEQFSRKWLAMEMLAIVCNVMWIKLKDLDSRVAKLERPKR
jgi:hypothetical protein